MIKISHDEFPEQSDRTEADRHVSVHSFGNTILRVSCNWQPFAKTCTDRPDGLPSVLVSLTHRVIQGQGCKHQAPAAHTHLCWLVQKFIKWKKISRAKRYKVYQISDLLITYTGQLC